MEMEKKTKNDIIQELRRIDKDSSYYQITLIGNKDGKISWYTYSHWVGWVNDKPGFEIREASIVNAHSMAKFWQDVGLPYVVVNSPATLTIFMRLGGHALIEKSIAEQYLPEMIKPESSAIDGPRGFKTLSSAPKSATKRVPNPKHRMNIIKRDDFRCRICGRRPDDYVDVEFHVHHIRPWGGGGLTEDQNLITLCQTCHKGLDPHGDISLFELLDPEAFRPDLERKRQKHLEGVRYYRDCVENGFKESKS